MPEESVVDSKLNQREVTTFILVRHAEKDTIKGDPNLTSVGHERAKDLARFLSDFPVTQIYSSDYKRTRQTAGPIAEANGLDIKLYNPRDPAGTATEMFNNHASETILVVGHSNSTPNFANTLLGVDKIEKIDESDYDNIFIVEATQLGDAKVIHLHYGNQ